MSRFPSGTRFDYDEAHATNFTRGVFRKDFIVMHWWDLPSRRPTFAGVLSWFKNPASSVSVAYMCEANRVAQLIPESAMGWHAGYRVPNHHGIAIEVNPRLSAGDYEAAAQVVAEIRRRRNANLPLRKHNDWSATTCPGTMDVNRIQRRATQINTGSSGTTGGGGTGGNSGGGGRTAQAGFYRATTAASLHVEPDSTSKKVRDVEEGELLIISAGARETEWWIQVGDNLWVQSRRVERRTVGSANPRGHHGEYPDRAIPVNGTGTAELEKAWRELFLRIGWWKGSVQSSMWQYFTSPAIGYGGNTVQVLQMYLRDRGFYTGAIDGIRGPLTITGEKMFLNGQLQYFTPAPPSAHRDNRAYSGKVY